MPLDLDAVEEPKFEVRHKGVLRQYDPWVLAAKLERVKDMKSMDEQVGAIRGVFENPDLTTNQCFAAMSALLLFVKELPEIKKLQGLTPSFSGSTQA